jgi:hypothetical protein
MAFSKWHGCGVIGLGALFGKHDNQFEGALE